MTYIFHQVMLKLSLILPGNVKVVMLNYQSGKETAGVWFANTE